MPASRQRFACATEASISLVSVLAMVCMRIGLLPPIRRLPTQISLLIRLLFMISSVDYKYRYLFRLVLFGVGISTRSCCL